MMAAGVGAEELDQQFAKVAAQVTMLALSQPKPVKLRAQAWLIKLREPTNNPVFKRNRNLYGSLLLAQLQQGRLEPPFTSSPPDGALPNLPQHLAYRGLSPARISSRAFQHHQSHQAGDQHQQHQQARSGSVSPSGDPQQHQQPRRGRRGAGGVGAKGPEHSNPPHPPHLGPAQLAGLVETFHDNMRARGFDLRDQGGGDVRAGGGAGGAGQKKAAGTPRVGGSTASGPIAVPAAAPPEAPDAGAGGSDVDLSPHPQRSLPQSWHHHHQQQPQQQQPRLQSQLPSASSLRASSATSAPSATSGATGVPATGGPMPLSSRQSVDAARPGSSRAPSAVSGGAVSAVGGGGSARAVSVPPAPASARSSVQAGRHGTAADPDHASSAHEHAESEEEEVVVTAALLAAKEAELAARAAQRREAKQRREAEAAAAALQRQRERSAAGKAKLDAVIAAAAGAREQWASPASAAPASAHDGRSRPPPAPSPGAWAYYHIPQGPAQQQLQPAQSVLPHQSRGVFNGGSGGGRGGVAVDAATAATAVAGARGCSCVANGGELHLMGGSFPNGSGAHGSGSTSPYAPLLAAALCVSAEPPQLQAPLHAPPVAHSGGAGGCMCGHQHQPGVASQPLAPFMASQSALEPPPPSPSPSPLRQLLAAQLADLARCTQGLLERQ